MVISQVILPSSRQAGTKLVSYVVELKDGNETGRKVLEEGAQEAIAQVIVKGGQPSFNPDCRKSDLKVKPG
jgi:uncharacterized protein YabE (DUF348 family)